MPADIAPSPITQTTSPTSGAPRSARHGEAEPGRDRGRGMRRPERVVGALRPPGEARQPAARPQRADAVAPPGQDLVRIALMADVPDQLVPRRVEDGMDRHRQLDHPEPGAEVPAGHAHRRDRLGAQLVRHLGSSAIVSPFRSAGSANPVEHRRLRSRIGHLRHAPPPSAAASEDELRRRAAGSRPPSRRARGCRMPRRPGHAPSAAPPSTPISDTKVALPRASSLRSRLPAASASPSTSRMSSPIW